MATVAQRFQNFLSNIQLTERQIEDAITKHTGVRESLHNAYYDTQFISTRSREIYRESTVKSYFREKVDLDTSTIYYTSLLVGSYGKNTAIAPPSDIDILFIMPVSEYYRYNNYTHNGQSALLQAVKKVLQAKYTTTKMGADGQVVVVPFTSYAVEVLPAFRHEDGYFLYPNANNGGSWEQTNPKEEMKYLSNSNQVTKGNTIRLIKMIKAWKNYCNVPIKSLVIELRTVNFLSDYTHADKGYLYYDWMIRDFFSELVTCANWKCPIPGIDEDCYYGDAWLSKAKSALNRATKACDYEKKYTYLATEEWKKIFGSRFTHTV